MVTGWAQVLRRRRMLKSEPTTEEPSALRDNDITRCPGVPQVSAGWLW